MHNVRFQIILNHQLEFESFFEDIKSQIIEEISSLYDGNFDFKITINYVKNIEDNKFLLGIELKSETEILEIFNRLIIKIKTEFQNVTIFKYFDSVLLDKLQRIYPEIFEIEMKLRECVSLIFVDKYKDNYYNLLDEFRIKPQNEKRENELQVNYENQFFHILFTDYTKFSTRTQIKPTDFESFKDFLSDASDFIDLQTKIRSKGQFKEMYLNFFNGIKRCVDSIENMRNCIAHNRNYSETEYDNYLNAKSELNVKLNEFLININN